MKTHRVFRWQFSLRMFLVLCAIVGCAIGLIIQWQRAPTFCCDSRFVDGFEIQAMWMRQMGEEDRLVYLLAFPHGNRYGGGTSLQAFGQPGSGVTAHPLGPFIHGTNARLQHPACRCWVYVNSVNGGDARPIEDDGMDGFVNRSHLQRLEATDFWKNCLRPALIRETQAFGRWYFDKNGSWPPGSRFQPSTTQAGSQP